MKDIPLWDGEVRINQNGGIRAIRTIPSRMKESKPFLLGWRDQNHSCWDGDIRATSRFSQPHPSCSKSPQVLTLTHHKDLSRLIAGGLGLGGLDLLEELLEDPQEGLVIPGTENLGDEPATLAQELTGQFQGHEGQISCNRREKGVRE